MDYYVPSVALAMRILKLLGRYKYKSCSLKDISDLVGSNKTTCLRVLRTMESEDFVKYDAETKKYSLGPYLIPLGKRALQLNDSVALAAEELKSVAAETRFTTVLIERLRDDFVIYIASEEPPNEEVKISVSIGQQFPIVGPSFGSCFLAYDDEQEWNRIAQTGLVHHASKIHLKPEHFIEKLKETKKSGYAVSHGDWLEGISGISVPIFGKNGQVEFAMACLAMTSQLEVRKEREAETIGILVEKAKKLSEWNGYQNTRRSD